MNVFENSNLKKSFKFLQRYLSLKLLQRYLSGSLVRAKQVVIVNLTQLTACRAILQMVFSPNFRDFVARSCWSRDGPVFVSTKIWYSRNSPKYFKCGIPYSTISGTENKTRVHWLNGKWIKRTWNAKKLTIGIHMEVVIIFIFQIKKIVTICKFYGYFLPRLHVNT